MEGTCQMNGSIRKQKIETASGRPKVTKTFKGKQAFMKII